MKLAWSSRAWDDYLYWQKTDKKKLKRINTFIIATLRQPFEGIGNPEPLKHELQGFWSRRIDKEHRLIYSYTERGIITWLIDIILNQSHTHPLGPAINSFDLYSSLGHEGSRLTLQSALAKAKS